MSARSQLAAALSAGMPSSIHIVDNPRTVTAGSEILVQLLRTDVAPLPQAPVSGAWINAFEILLVVPTTDLEHAEDALDDALEDLLELLDRLEWITWDNAAREVYPEGERPMYRVKASLMTHPTEPEPAPVPADEPAPVPAGGES